ncbi:hypothetical protein J8J27_24970, partial [Mycobacterium tuberculosis]|nr:hypothetical protein [Mycobacterium tuberculosis]
QYADDFVPLSVALEQAGQVLVPEGGIGFGWQTQDIHPSGACGNAAAADAERGRIAVERGAAALVRLLEEVIAYPLDRLTAKTIYDAA